MIDNTPLIHELIPAPEPEEAFLRLYSLPHCLFLDSADDCAGSDTRLGRYSFLAADPFAFFAPSALMPNPFSDARAALRSLSAQTVADLPPFQGGAAGLLGYALGQRFETVPAAATDEFGVPEMALGLYDVVISWDHREGRAWIISQGLPETRPHKRRARAEERLRQVQARLSGNGPLTGTPRSRNVRRLATGDLIPQFPVSHFRDLTSNFSRRDYLGAVERAIDYIAAGDIFQVNLAQRLLHPTIEEPVSFYLRLRSANPAPFAGYFDMGKFQICSASPERFLQVRDKEVETRPIKGTRRRSADPDTDEAAKDALLRSEKDRAENVMIVDLLRNDLGRVCKLGSVRVGDVCRLETYATVHHLVSSVHGRLRSDADPWDLIAASFPGGSITGAPKIRAMQIIAELEPAARGAYCGSLGYIGFDGSADWNLLIRTVTAGRGWWQAPVGGGIVADSDPVEEYEETWHKAEGLVRAMNEAAAERGEIRIR